MSGTPRSSPHKAPLEAPLEASRIAPPRSRGTQVQRGLEGVAMAACALAVVLLAWPRLMPTTSAVAPTAASPSRVDTSESTPLTLSVSRVDSLAQRVVSTNVFSATRRAPTARFVVPGQTSAPTGDVMLSATSALMADSAALSGERFPRLTGIVLQNGERLALLQLFAEDGAPRLYRAGEQRGRMRVVRIDATQILLSGPAGSRVLRLDARATPDSLEILP